MKDDRRDLADRPGDRHPVRHLGRPGVRGLLGAAHRRRGATARSCSAAATSPLALFAVALAGTGLLTTVGVIVVDGHLRPGLRQRAGHRRDVRRRRGRGRRRCSPTLDAVGNTTKAITKGIAIATAVLAATALFGSYPDAVEHGAGRSGGQDVASMLGSFATFTLERRRSPNNARRADHRCGGRVPVLGPGDQRGRARGRCGWSSRCASSSATSPGSWTGTEQPDYGRVVDICTSDSLRELAHAGSAGRPGARSRSASRLGYRPAGRLPGRRDRGRHADGGVPGQLRAAPGTTPRSSSRTVTTAARAPTPTRRPSSATPSATRSRTPPARRSTR